MAKVRGRRVVRKSRNGSGEQVRSRPIRGDDVRAKIARDERESEADVEVSGVSSKRTRKSGKGRKARASVGVQVSSERDKVQNIRVRSSSSERDRGEKAVRRGSKASKEKARVRRSSDTSKVVRRTSRTSARQSECDGVTPLQPTYVPAKNKGYGCKYCKFLQYVKDANLEGWKGTRKEVKDSVSKKPFIAQSHRINGTGPKDADIMFVGEAPGYDEDMDGIPFIGRSGKVLKGCLKLIGLTREDVYVTNIVRCRPPNNATPTYTDCVACSAYLSEEIRRVKPKVIVALGKAALQAVLGSRTAKITEAHGNPLKMEVSGHKCIVFPMWHPAYVLRNDYLKDDYKDAFKKLAQVVEGDVKVTKDTGNYVTVISAAECIDVIKSFTNIEEITAFDFETSGLKPFQKGQRAACLALSKDEEKGYCIPLYYGPWMKEPPEEVTALGWSKKEWVSVINFTREFFTSSTPKIGHNVKFDMNWAEAMFEVVPANIVNDTMLMHYAVDENNAHGLKPLALKYTNMGAYDDQLDIEAKKYKKRYDLIPLNILGEYAAMDGVATTRVYDVMCDEIEAQGEEIETLACDVLPRALLTMQEMEARGAHIDIEFSRDLLTDMSERIDDLTMQLEALPIVRKFIRDKTKYAEENKKKFKFSVNSPKQMAELFFGTGREDENGELLYGDKYLGYKPLDHKFTAAGAPSTDKEVMEHLIVNNDCDVAKIKKDLGLWSKLKSTYVESMLTEALNDHIGGYIHGNLNLHGTVTGRLSSSSPNLQNIPNKGAAVVKRMFDSRFGDDGALLQADYSQIELRLLGSLSQDRKMTEIYKNGLDIHKNTTLSIFSEYLNKLKKTKRYKKCKTITEVYDKMEEYDKHEHKRMRTIGKRVNFGIAYGIGAEGTVNVLRGEGVIITADEAREYINKFHTTYKEASRWIERTHRDLEVNGVCISAYGRRRRLPEVFSEDEEYIARAKRQGTNDLVQSPASDTTLTALILINEYLKENGFKSIPIITVHDSILIDCVREEIEEVSQIVKTIMEDIADYAQSVWGDNLDIEFLTRLPIRADIEVGVNWRDMVTIDDHTTVSDALMKSEIKALGEESEEAA